MSAVAITTSINKSFRLVTDKDESEPFGRFVDGIEILDEIVYYSNGPFLRIKRWLRGAHPELGVLIWGYTGIETLVDKDVVRPLHRFEVVE